MADCSCGICDKLMAVRADKCQHNVTGYGEQWAAD